MKKLLIALFAFSFSFSPFSVFGFDRDDCEDQVQRLKRAARDAEDAIGSLDYGTHEIASALSDVESRLARAKTACFVPDFCTSIKNIARTHGSKATYHMCLMGEVGDRLILCKICSGYQE